MDNFRCKLGRVPSIDERNKRFLMQPRQEVTRKNRYWPNFGPILNQGNQPHCVGYAGFKWLRMNPIVNNPKGFDADWLYHEAKKNDEWNGENYDGTSALGLMKVLKREGYVTEYRWAYDIDTVVLNVLNHGPVLMGTYWFRDMFYPDANNYIHPNGVDDGGHEYIIRGVNIESTNPDGSKGKAQIINSWGAKWGKRGMVWITLNDLSQLLKNHGDCVSATEFNKD